jgi:tetratricopeptide (TPR) repeat protein
MPTDYERHLARIGEELARLAGEPASADRATRIAHCLYRRASMTGDLAELDAAEAAVDAGIEEFGAWPDLCFVKANVDFKLHRLERVRADLELSPAFRVSAEGRAIAADLDLEEGRYEEARRGYESLVADERSWSALARLANLEAKLGDRERADELYGDAEDELTAKELRSYCWLELQRGDLCPPAEAERHYERAERAYSGDWLVDQHKARLRAAQGRLDEALALYCTVAARAPRPEAHQALGDVYLRMGRPEEARPWHDLALAAYLDSVERGGVHYLHHLAHFYLESRPDPAEAARWARADYELRPNLETQALWDRAVEAEEGRAEAAARPEARREQVRHAPVGDDRLVAAAARPGERSLGQRDTNA